MPRISYQQIQQNISEIANREYYSPTIIYDLLLAYGKPKATVTKLQNGVINFARHDGVLLKDAVFFKIFPAGTVLESKVEQLKHDNRTERYRPRYLIATDLQNIAAYDRRQEVSLSTKLRDLDKDFTFFYGLSGNETSAGQKEEAYADRKAAERMKELYDEIVKCNSERILSDNLNFRHDLNIFFSRLLFCYFAEDTDLFEPKQFTNSVKSYTKTDGSDLPYFFEQLFKSLDSRPNEKQDMVDPFNKFPYVNGTIFDTKKHTMLIPKFNAQARHLLIQLAESDWSGVNPDIFGTIFQGIVDPQKRDENGMDYTSVDNINKVIGPLFMNELWAEYDKDFEDDNRIKDKNGYKVDHLNALWDRIANIKIFDPACGSGNFLIITYKALRELEQNIIRKIDELMPGGVSVKLDSRIKLNHFYGIEIEDFPRELAVLSMFIAAHQMNIKFEEEFGKELTIIPIKDMPTIIRGNSIEMEWNSVCPNLPTKKSTIGALSQTALLDDLQEREQIQKAEYDEIYVIGNPPYKGANKQTAEQKNDFRNYFGEKNYSKNLDYVSLWFLKGSEYIRNTNAQLAFVSTCSICQGEQVEYLFSDILDNNIEIGFAYRPFRWTNNAKDNAGVIVIILGLRNVKMNTKKYIYDDNLIIEATNINPYIIDYKNLIIKKSKEPINELPKMLYGSKPVGDKLMLSSSERKEIINADPDAAKWIKQFINADDLINGKENYCLWIPDEEADEALSHSVISERIKDVAKKRSESKKAATRKLASAPYKFGEIRYKKSDAIVVPSVSSERREYIPLGFFIDSDVVVSNRSYVVYDACPWIFSILNSKMFNIWNSIVCAKLGTSFAFSSQLGYNIFPIPLLDSVQKEQLNESAMMILMARENHTEMTLAQMYDPDKMPEDLREAHNKNNLLIDKLYQPKAFLNDEERLSKLFAMYEDMTKDEKI